MSASEPALTPMLIEAICTRLRAGAFEQVAVEAMGVPWHVYQDWLRRGEQPDCPAEYQQLAAGVRQALADARLKVEMELHETDAKVWLLHGPGRETPTRGGWGLAGRSTGEPRGDDPAMVLELCAALLDALTPFPEARSAAAAALERFNLSSAG